MSVFLDHLRRCRAALAVSPLPVGTRFIVCTGNESCDIDSMTCALTYAVFRQRQLDAAPSGDGPTLVLPLWQVERQDIALRGETLWLLNSLRLGDVISEVFKPIAVCSAQGVGRCV